MKCSEYTRMETTLQNAMDDLEETWGMVDTSIHNPKKENKNSIREFNDDYIKVMELLRELKESMIFTFEIEED